LVFESEEATRGVTTSGRRRRGTTPQLDSYSDLATLLNVVDALVPIALIAAKHTITINANITAYSTAVGPASDTRKRCILPDNGIILGKLYHYP
jgi:hypothetical protein